MVPDLKTGVLTVSDKGYAGLRVDESGKAVSKLLASQGYSVVLHAVVPDESPLIARTLIQWVDEEHLALIVTTGGTGLSPRDVTPQATQQIIDFIVPGIGEAMRAKSMSATPHAMLSRAVAGVRNTCLILNLPGSTRGALENLEVVLPALPHALSKLAGDTSDCAPPSENHQNSK
ncbi:MAG TPA: MogA/MoaB family molybdenum cofactor biosynthesis protein [Desulfobacteraceae bacterium]|nr:MogA/MoaB family molybdenum cofactor biosynthesis protein [Desulfobacteraceae bacterium]